VLLVSLAGAGAGAWIAYFRWKDKRRPEPWVVLLLTCMAGVVAVGAALLGYGLLEGAGRAPTWEALGGAWRTAIPTALAIGLVEETAKLLPVLVVVGLTRHFDELWDGPVYAGAAGIGFALAETLSFLLAGELGTVAGAARAVAAPITHALFVAPAGLGLAYAVLERRRWALPVGFVASVATHGLYDLFLARPGLQLAAAGVVAAIWVWLLAVARHLTRRRA
jgi:RsiW-degrading membrane proteinase PrsW (M82 family)